MALLQERTGYLKRQTWTAAMDVAFSVALTSCGQTTPWACVPGGILSTPCVKRHWKKIAAWSRGLGLQRAQFPCCVARLKHVWPCLTICQALKIFDNHATTQASKEGRSDTNFSVARTDFACSVAYCNQNSILLENLWQCFCKRCQCSHVSMADRAQAAGAKSLGMIRTCFLVDLVET